MQKIVQKFSGENAALTEKLKNYEAKVQEMNTDFERKLENQ